MGSSPTGIILFSSFSRVFRVEKLSPIPEGSNPFLYDAFNMGRYIGKNLLLMQGNHDSEECKYIILVNQKTGERTRLIFSDYAETQKHHKDMWKGFWYPILSKEYK